MKFAIETITPEKAHEYLGHNIDNYRKLNTQRVITYAADMKSGKWQLNGESIKFAKNGTLLDGQHRLQAIVKADVPVQMLVVTDVDDEVSMYDICAPRSLASILYRRGVVEANFTTLVGVANFIVGNGSTAKIKGNGAVIDYVEDHVVDIQKALSAVSSSKNPICKKAPIIAAVYCLYREGRDLNDIANFCRIANSGLPQGHYEPSSALIFRNTLQEFNIHTNEQRKALFCVAVTAIDDFLNGKARTIKYKANPKEFELLHKIRSIDGLCDD